MSETYGSSRDHGDTTTSDGGGPERFPGTSDQPDLDPHYYEGDIWDQSGLVWRVLLGRQTAGCASHPRTVTVCLHVRHPLGTARVQVATTCPTLLDMLAYRPSL